MKLLSLWEPWATLMAIGAKRIETRSWKTSYRGFVAIHASNRGLPKGVMEACLEESYFKRCLAGESLSPGCIVAVVKLERCVPVETIAEVCPELYTGQEYAFGDYSPAAGRWAWVTTDLFRLPKPIPFRARQGLVEVPEEIVREIRRQYYLAIYESIGASR